MSYFSDNKHVTSNYIEVIKKTRQLLGKKL